MTRFHIEEIVEQDKHGVVFRAHDVKSAKLVSLRRFFPFGQDGGGLEKDEAVAFEIASERLAGISHESLRSVIMGSVDPIDGIPYLATEWVEGTPLNEILAGESMDPALVIDVLRIALEVSILLSEVLGEEAVWVETELGSIVIGTKESGRGFTFWISPFKWLGAEFGSRKLSAILELGETLTGWEGKAVSNNSGYGLGGWFKWLKMNPDASLSEALEMMTSSVGNETPLPVADPVEPAVSPQAPWTAPKPSRKPVVVIAVLTILLLISGTFFYLKKIAEPQQIAAESGELESAAALGSQVPARPQSASERASARAKELQVQTASMTPPAAKPPVESGKIYTPDDKELWSAIKTGAPVKLGGILRKVQLSSTGKSIYLFFSDPVDAGELGGVAHRDSFKGDFREEAFMPFVGKNLVLTGTCFKEPTGRILVKIPEIRKIRVVE